MIYRYINLDDIVCKYDNTYHSTIKRKPADVKSNTYINTYIKEINYKDPKFKIGDIVRTSRHKRILGKGYVPNCSEDVFVITKVITMITYVISDLKNEEISETFYKKELQKTNQKELRVEKVVKKCDKIYLNWNVYDNSFNSWIDEKDVA